MSTVPQPIVTTYYHSLQPTDQVSFLPTEWVGELNLSYHIMQEENNTMLV